MYLHRQTFITIEQSIHDFIKKKLQREKNYQLTWIGSLIFKSGTRAGKMMLLYSTSVAWSAINRRLGRVKGTMSWFTLSLTRGGSILCWFTRWKIRQRGRKLAICTADDINYIWHFSLLFNQQCYQIICQFLRLIFYNWQDTLYLWQIFQDLGEASEELRLLKVVSLK